MPVSSNSLTATIVIPNLNYGQYLEYALESIDLNIFKPKVLVVDGLSTDSTLKILSEQSQRNLSWFSLKDAGPAQAINYGFKNVDSDIIGWLNSDDYYAPKAVDRAMSVFQKNPKLMMVYGNAKHVDVMGKVISNYPTKLPDVGVKEFMRGCFICQPTVFFRKAALEQLGYLDESLETAFDFDFWIRFFKKYKANQIAMINHTQAYSRLHQLCITERAREKVITEGIKIVFNYFSKPPIYWAQTFVEECIEKYPFIEEEQGLIQIIQNFLSKIQPFFAQDDYQHLLSILKNDHRLKLSNSQVQIGVLSDGWVSKQLLIKMRYRPGQSNAVGLQCSVAWPKALADQKITLLVRSSDGQFEKVTLSGSDDFTLKLEAPERIQASFTSWMITTRQSFTPATHLKKSNDTRSLSFRVDSFTML